MARANPWPEREIVARSAAPNTTAAAAAPAGFHRPSATIAIAMNPRPADIPSANVPTWASTSVPPLTPPSTPPAMIAAELDAAHGDSRDARGIRILAHRSQREASVRPVCPPPESRYEQHRRHMRPAVGRRAPVPAPGMLSRTGSGIGCIVGIVRAAPDGPNSHRYNVPVTPRPSSVTAVPAMIWSERSIAANTAKTAAIAAPPAAATRNPMRDATHGCAGHRAECAGNDDAFEADVDHTRLLGERLPQSGEQEGRRGSDGRLEKCRDRSAHAGPLPAAGVVTGRRRSWRIPGAGHRARAADAARMARMIDASTADTTTDGTPASRCIPAAPGLQCAEENAARNDRQRIEVREQRHGDRGIAIPG